MNHALITSLIPSHAFKACIALMLFSIDLSFLAFFKTASILSLFSYTLTYFLNKKSAAIVCFNFFLIGLYGFIATGLVIPYLSFFFALYALTVFCSLYSSHRLFVYLISIFLASLYPYLFSNIPSCTLSNYTIAIIVANLILMNFSLKWSSAVK